MALRADESVRFLRGVGEVRAERLEKLGILTLRDLIAYYPRAYEDRRTLRTIAQLRDGESACVRAMAAGEASVSRTRQGLAYVKLRVVDESAAMDLTFFNQRYLRGVFRTGESYVFYGRAEGTAQHRRMTNPLFEPEGTNRATGRIVPVYPLTAGLTGAVLGETVRRALEECEDAAQELLDEDLRARRGLCPARFALENIHFPASDAALAAARRRLAFEELFLLSLGLRLLRSRRDAAAATACRETDMQPFYAALPFSLTAAQRRAVGDCLRDMGKPRPMNRLLQGDVGSGKTMVAAACICRAALSGLQCALMAPTEILAEQHYRSLSPLLARLGIRSVLLTGALRARERREALALLAAGEAQLAVGTHALLSASVSYRNLGLVVTDEQHRFGVAQRAALGEKGENPHLLVMSATPIPRTLALMIYGDLDVSVLDELPPGRQKIDTYAVSSSYRARIYAFLKKQVAEGRQAYIVCPAVEEADGEEGASLKAVSTYAEELSEKVFPELRVAAVHGKLPAKKKDAVMRAFAAGETDILVSTTVVEVGVDVPNASVMLIENAERFGLSQLHQLRGRVGRGKHKSYCILLSDSAGEDSRRRLRVMTHTQSGFEIADEDLRLRGPGDFFGARQHGLPALRVSDLRCDMALVRESAEEAAALLAADTGLEKHEALRRRVEALFSLRPGAMN